MVNFIKKVPKFQAVCFTGLESVTELAQLAATSHYRRAGYRVETGQGDVTLFLKTDDAAGRVVSESDIKMEIGQVLVLSRDSGVLTVMSDEDFRNQFEVAQ